MSGERFSLRDIAFGESLMRVGAHLDNALASYSAREITDAIVHANRSLELMPGISSELWRWPDLSTALNQTVAGVLSALRRRDPVSEVTAARAYFEALSTRALSAVVAQEAASPAYRASVVVALLRTAAAAAEAGAHPDAHALVARSRSLTSTLWGGAISPETLEDAFEALSSALPSRREASRAAIGTIADILHDSFGAVLELDEAPRTLLDRAASRLAEAGDAARAGDRFRADKLVARAYVEDYSEAREALGAWAKEAELDDLIGTQIRLGLAAGRPVDDLIARACDLLASAPL